MTTRKTIVELTYLDSVNIPILFGCKQNSLHIVERTLEIIKVGLAAAQFLAKGSTELVMFVLLTLQYRCIVLCLYVF